MKCYRIFTAMATTLAFLAFVVSCQHDDSSTSTSPDVLGAQSEISIRLKNFTSPAEINDNILDSADCYSIKLPVHIKINGQSLNISTKSDYALVVNNVEASKQDEDKIIFTFPITLVYSNNDELVVSEPEEYMLLKADCNYPDQMGGKCFSFVYPLTIYRFTPDQQQQNVITINRDSELFGFLSDMGASEVYSLKYPLSAKVNGETNNVSSNTELTTLLNFAAENCKSNSGPCTNPNILDDGLIMYIPFADEASDLTGFGNATLEGPVQYVADRDGNPNAAISFLEPTLNNLLTVDGSIHSNMMENGEFTISLWFNRQNPQPSDQTQMFEQLISIFNGFSHFGTYVGVKESGSLMMGPMVVSSNLDQQPLYDNTWFDDSQMLGQLDVWHHIAVTWDGQLLTLYRNGIPCAASPGTQFAQNMSGARFGGYFMGFLDDIRIYDRLLTSSEIKLLYKLSGDINTCYEP